MRLDDPRAGASAMVAFRIRREREAARVGALLELSNAYFGAAYILLGLVLLTGIVVGVMGTLFTDGRLWLWVSVVLLVAMAVAMYFLATGQFNRVRHAVGLQTYDDVKKGRPAPTPLDEVGIAAAITAGRPELVAAIGFGGIAVVTWLMMFKPF